MVWIQWIEKDIVEEADEINARSYVEKQAPFLTDCKDPLALTAMTSLVHNAIHHSFWVDFEEG